MSDLYIVIDRALGESEVWRRCSGTTGCKCGKVYHSHIATAAPAYARLVADALNASDPRPAYETDPE